MQIESGVDALMLVDLDTSHVLTTSTPSSPTATVSVLGNNYEQVPNSHRHDPAMPAVRSSKSAASSAKPTDIITVDDSSDEDWDPKAKVLRVHARTGSSRAAGNKPSSSNENLHSGGRRRSKRQASKKADTGRKSKENTPISSPLRSSASSSKHRAPSAPPSPPPRQKDNKHIQTEMGNSSSSSDSAAGGRVEELQRKVDEHARETEKLKAAASEHNAQLEDLEIRSAVLASQVDSHVQTFSSIEQCLTCAICMDIHLRPFTIVPCGHNCCVRCLRPWLAINKTCPLCAVDVMRAFPNSDMQALAQLFLEAHPEKQHDEEDRNDAETMFMLAREASTVPNFVQLLPRHEQAARNEHAANPPPDQYQARPLAQYHVQLPDGPRPGLYAMANPAAQQAQRPAPLQAQNPPAVAQANYRDYFGAMFGR
ncbi:unnamed protein product [Tilletia controversa]|uniref:RING-type domain-containing protein n=3 Tax=Tilletia TaxID=13289 RepID=A0A8X7MZN6_9BASI|nr:hypothetical protein CF328_g662 [Tilletia controversa]KAE8254938.1 hypothetical protein A4X06_0g668 [Tilletia controversa]CAD6897434.1 unnamed protein product [Tilletia controversa]CAD6973563.1 unnamed protein product [Tilletia controversa]